MAYVYRHIRLDKNEPFYIGIGGDDDYKRAYDKNSSSRNKYWNNIVSKTEYEIEILLDGLSWDDACNKEVEFISIHKRRKDGGTLANLTLGGEGQRGMIPWNFGKETPIETREKQRLKKLGKSATWMIGTKIKPEVREAMRKALSGKPAWNRGVSPSPESRAKFMKSMEGRFLKGEQHPNYGKPMLPHVKEKMLEANRNRPPWNKGKKCNYKVPHEKFKKPVIQYDLNMNFIAEYESVSSTVAAVSGTRKGEISNCCTGRIKFHKGFIFRYKHEKPRFQGRSKSSLTH